MERPSVGIVSQIGFETTPGTAVAANKLLKSVSFNPKIKQTNQKFRAQGYRMNTVLARHKNWGEGDYNGVLDYNQTNYIFESLFGAATPSLAATGAYQRDWIPGTKTADNPRTLTIQKGDATAADIYPFGVITSFSMEATQEDFNIKGNLLAQAPTLNSALTSNPTEIAERPVQRGDINVYMDDTFGTIGMTLLAKVQREMLEISDKIVPAWFHNRSKGSFTDIAEKEYEPAFEMTLAHDAQSRTLNAAIASNPEKILRWQAQGNLITGTTYELIQIDMAVRFEEPEEIGDSDGIYAYKYKCMLNPNSSLGSYMKIRTICTLATL